MALWGCRNAEVHYIALEAWGYRSYLAELRDMNNDNGIKTMTMTMIILKYFYYSFKIFPRFWLVKTTRIIHHKQLLLTKYWTNDVKSAARCKLLNRWRHNDVKSAARCRLLNRWPRKPGGKVVLYLVNGRTKSEMQNSFKNGEIFWMKNKAIIEFGFLRIWRILQIKEVWITP